MGDKWLDEEVLEDAPGFANLEIIKITIQNIQIDF